MPPLAPPFRPLDRLYARQCAAYLGCSPQYLEQDEILRTALAQWHYEHLLLTCLHARHNSLAYRDSLACLPLREWLRQAQKRTWMQHKAALASHNLANHNLHEQTAQVLAALPFTLPEQVAAAPESFLAVPHDAVEGVITVHTSGTTSPQGKRIFCTQEDLTRTVDFFCHGMRYMVRPHSTDRVALLMSGQREGSVGALLQAAMQAIGLECHILGFPVDEDAALDAVCACRPTCIVGVPKHVLALARHPRTARSGLKTCLRNVLLSGDGVNDSIRTAIATALDCEVFVHYGLTESGLGGAVECPVHHGCHVRHNDIFVEICTPEGQPVPAGTWGEIVVSTLTRQAMPLLRYRTGDAGRLLAQDCPCESLLPRLEAQGRLSEAIPYFFGHMQGLLQIESLNALVYAQPCLRAYTISLYTEDGPTLALGLHLHREDASSGKACENIRRAVAALWPFPLAVYALASEQIADVLEPKQRVHRLSGPMPSFIHSNIQRP